MNEEMEDEFERIDKENSWIALYQYIRSKAKEYALPHKEARKPSNVHLNRYKDVYPYDHSRICLQRADTDYINASLVPVPEAKRSYILAQGPLPTTTSHFWAMIWEQKSRAIVMLNRIIEKNIIKCHKYWPSCNEDELILEDVSLKVSNQEEEISTDYVIRHLLLTDLETNESRIIYHFHYMTWPDFGVPETPEQFLHFLQIVKEKGVLDDTSGPAVIHCSAGIGRSGTFCLVDSSLIMIKEAKTLDINSIKDLLLEMRRFRMGLIQTADQLRFSYLAIIEGAKSILRENEQPLVNQQPKVELIQDELSSESSSDTLSESSEPTSEESSNNDEGVFCGEEESALKAEHSQEIQNYNEGTVEIESSDVSGSESSETESSDSTETELDYKNDSAKMQFRHHQEAEKVYEATDGQLTDEIFCKDTKHENQQNTGVSIDSTSSDNHRQSLETSGLSQQSTLCSSNDIVKETSESVNATEMPDRMKKMNVGDRNQVALSSDVHSQNEVNPTSASLNNPKQPSVEQNIENPSGLSENSKTLLNESQKVNVSGHCEDGKQCPASNEHSSDKLSSAHTDQMSNEECVTSDDDDLSAGVMSRHLEFYQNGDIYSSKEYKCNTAKNNSQSQKDRNSDNIKNNKKLPTQCSFRSSSCPRQLPSISKPPYSRVDGDTQKRRNSTELGHPSDEDGNVPLKFQKMHEDHRDAEPEFVEELAILEDTHEPVSEDKAKEPLLRSKR